ncbi:PHB depolymerase family esterase [Nocardia sp. NPDC050712]|uniref:extracellular catalytic domain type 1 short-chain-length polyhydroxyalkanoate depolymerase n=1 Tax=Nocardia sp. NPDC050712 TaxID=3155518 RepID=UPI003401AE16
MILRFLCAAIVVALCGAAPATADPGAGELSYGEVGDERGSMRYALYVPPGVGERPVPLVVHLHGGRDDVALVAVRSRLNTLAREQGFVVVYPQESRAATGTGVWDWSGSAAAGREGRAPALIAAITRQVRHRLPIAAHQVFVGGISAGAGMATVMAATYPDLFASVHTEVGCMYQGAGCELPTPKPQSTFDPEQSGLLAFRAMGAYLHRMPFLVSSGSLDPIAQLSGQDALVQQWLVTNDYADDGAANGSVPRAPARVGTGRVNGRDYTVSAYADARGCLLGQRWLIDGLFHAYSGGQPTDPTDLLTDPTGPDIRAVAQQFALRQTERTPDGSPACVPIH